MLAHRGQVIGSGEHAGAKPLEPNVECHRTFLYQAVGVEDQRGARRQGYAGL